MGIVQVFLDPSAPWIITGPVEFDVTEGGHLKLPQGTAFPTDPAPESGDFFHRTDENKTYRYNGTTWVLGVAAVAAHASSHQPGGSDTMAVDAAAGTGSLRTLGTGATQACSGTDARLSDARTPTAHKTSHEPGGGDAMAVDAVAGTGSLRTLGTGAQQACAGNDARLSDNRTDANAIHKNVSAEISTITEKVTPVAADLLVIEDSAASNAKKRVQIGNLPAGSAPIFGRDYASGVSEANSTTTSSTYQDKVSLVTGALTGTYLVEWQCEMTIASANRLHRCRLYDATAAAELCNDDHRPSIANAWKLASGFALVTFVGAAKTLKIQFASQNNSTTVTIRRARVVMWRVS